MQSGEFDPTPIVTHSLPLDQLDKAFQMMLTGDASIKVQLQP